MSRIRFRPKTDEEMRASEAAKTKPVPFKEDQAKPEQESAIVEPAKTAREAAPFELTADTGATPPAKKPRRKKGEDALPKVAPSEPD